MLFWTIRLSGTTILVVGKRLYSALLDVRSILEAGSNDLIQNIALQSILLTIFQESSWADLCQVSALTPGVTPVFYASRHGIIMDSCMHSPLCSDS